MSPETFAEELALAKDVFEPEYTVREAFNNLSESKHSSLVEIVDVEHQLTAVICYGVCPNLYFVTVFDSSNTELAEGKYHKLYRNALATASLMLRDPDHLHEAYQAKLAQRQPFARRVNLREYVL